MTRKTLAHHVREAGGTTAPACMGYCRQGREACETPLACRVSVVRHYPMPGAIKASQEPQQQPEENSVLAFLDGLLCAVQPGLIGGIAVLLVAMAITAAYVIAWLIEAGGIAEKLGAL